MKDLEYFHDVFINITNMIVFQHYKYLNASRLLVFRFKWSIEIHKHEIENEFCSKIIDMQDADNSKLHMITIYKKSSSSLHDINSIKLEFLKLSLKEKQLYRWTLQRSHHDIRQYSKKMIYYYTYMKTLNVKKNILNTQQVKCYIYTWWLMIFPEMPIFTQLYKTRINS